MVQSTTIQSKRLFYSIASRLEFPKVGHIRFLGATSSKGCKGGGGMMS